MFESAAISRKLDTSEFKALEVDLRTKLLMAQLHIAEERKLAILLVIAGIDGAGKALIAQRLLEWLDPRHVSTDAFYLPTEEERQYPRMQRYWRALPAKGRMSIVFGSWYHQPLYERITGIIDEGRFQEDMHKIASFEALLVNDGYILCKLWAHLPRKERKKRAGARSSDWSLDVRMNEWGDLANLDYDLARGSVEEMARITSTAQAPWAVVPGADPNYRDALAGQVLLDRLQRELQIPCQPAPAPTPSLRAEGIPRPTVLDRLDLSAKQDPKSYRKKLKALQQRFHKLTQKDDFKNSGLILVFEGADAAGKGGCIRRIVRRLDPRIYRVHSIAAPTDEELRHPYLWRFWRHIPPRGRLVIFDRSWYGRVLVERVEGLCPIEAWQRAYQEIVDFEDELVTSGQKIMKFWLQISKEEQLKRFKRREQTPFKRFKITDEDWRNRKQWASYQAAAVEMVDRTSTINSPWILIPSEDKKFARIRILETLCDHFDKERP
jgi:polyphosphate:AMP phosphotransferase